MSFASLRGKVTETYATWTYCSLSGKKVQRPLFWVFPAFSPTFGVVELREMSHVVVGGLNICLDLLRSIMKKPVICGTTNQGALFLVSSKLYLNGSRTEILC